VNKTVLALIITSVLLSVTAQLVLKTGMNAYGQINIGIDMILAVFHPLVLVGLIT